jgi:hypothetical protein
MMYALNNFSRTLSEDGGSVVLSGKSLGGKAVNLTVNLVDLNRYMNGGLIQECFPYLSVDDREVCITGFDKEYWDKMFGGDDEEENDE